MKITIETDSSRWSRARRMLLGLCAVLAPMSVRADGTATIITFADGQPIRAADFNQNFQLVATAIHDDEARIATLEAQVAALQAALGELTTRLAPVSLVSDSITGKPTLVFSGVNVQVVSGSGATNDNGALTGLGNLIVGYNATRTPGFPDARTGSNNLIVGDQQNYTSYGGFAAGANDNIAGPFASVGGGFGNTSSGNGSAVSGGANNTASSFGAAVSGGDSNTASGQFALVSGGSTNLASGTESSVFGGNQLSVTTTLDVAAPDNGLTASVSSLDTTVAGFSSVLSHMSFVSSAPGTSQPTILFSGVNVQIVSGSGSTDDGTNGGLPANPSLTGRGNLIIGYNELRNDPDPSDPDVRTGSHNLIAGQWQNYASYGGFLAGETNSIAAAAPNASVSGGAGNTASAESSSVSGGELNTASGYASSVSGGRNNTASGDSAAVSGGAQSLASGAAASVSGGFDNVANNNFTSVSGGRENAAIGDSASVSGGGVNTADGLDSSVSGGFTNFAGADFASVSGGRNNNATGDSASVSGGNSVSEATDEGWAAGGTSAGTFHAP